MSSANLWRFVLLRGVELARFMDPKFSRFPWDVDQGESVFRHFNKIIKYFLFSVSKDTVGHSKVSV